MKKVIKLHVTDKRITWVSNYGYPTTKSSNLKPVIGHPHDQTPITWQIDMWRTKHNQEFCYRYDYYNSGHNMSIKVNHQKRS